MIIKCKKNVIKWYSYGIKGTRTSVKVVSEIEIFKLEKKDNKPMLKKLIMDKKLPDKALRMKLLKMLNHKLVIANIDSDSYVFSTTSTANSHRK